MAWQHDREMTLADGREVLVDYTVESLGSPASGLFGLPEDYDCGEGPELYVTRVRLAADGSSDEEIVLSDGERERIEIEIAENPDWWMPDDEGPDDWRDD